MTTIFGDGGTTGDGVIGSSKGARTAGVRGMFQEPPDRFGTRQLADVDAQAMDWHEARVKAVTDPPRPGCGVLGIYTGRPGTDGYGVRGESNFGDGVWGQTESSSKSGIIGLNFARKDSPPNIAGGNGVFGVSWVPNASGVFGAHNNGGVGVGGYCAEGIGVLGKGGKLAGRFEGDVEVTGDLRLANADCAERFDVVEGADISPGTVMVAAEGGVLQTSSFACDQRVIGVVSGAGSYRPAIVLDSRAGDAIRPAIALLGKVFCKVDAREASIAIGDLLTTSRTPGHAMKADADCRRGSVLGKALGKMTDGTGLIPILVTLQ